MDEVSFCPACGQPIKIRGLFCGKCGARIVPDEPVPAQSVPAHSVRAAKLVPHSVRTQPTAPAVAQAVAPAVTPAVTPAETTGPEPFQPVAQPVPAASAPVNVTLALPAGLTGGELNLWFRAAAWPLIAWAISCFVLSWLATDALSANPSTQALAAYAGKDVLSTSFGVIGSLLAGFGYHISVSGSGGVGGYSAALGGGSASMSVIPLGSVLLFAALLAFRLKKATGVAPVRSLNEAAIRVVASAALVAVPIWLLVSALTPSFDASFQQAVGGTSLGASASLSGGPNGGGLLLFFAILMVGGAVGVLAGSPSTVNDLTDRLAARVVMARVIGAGVGGYVFALALTTCLGVVVAVVVGIGASIFKGLDPAIVFKVIPAALAVAPTAAALLFAGATGSGIDTTGHGFAAACTPSYSYLGYTNVAGCVQAHAPSFWDYGPIVILLSLALLALPGLITGMILARNGRPLPLHTLTAGLVAAGMIVVLTQIASPSASAGSWTIVGSSSNSNQAWSLQWEMMRVLIVSALVSVPASFGGVLLYVRLSERAGVRGLTIVESLRQDGRQVWARIASVGAARPQVETSPGARTPIVRRPEPVSPPIRPAARMPEPTAPVGSKAASGPAPVAIDHPIARSVPVIRPELAARAPRPEPPMAATDKLECPWCGSQTLANRAFCVACGSRLAA